MLCVLLHIYGIADLDGGGKAKRALVVFSQQDVIKRSEALIVFQHPQILRSQTHNNEYTSDFLNKILFTCYKNHVYNFSLDVFCNLFSTV